MLKIFSISGNISALLFRLWTIIWMFLEIRKILGNNMPEILSKIKKPFCTFWLENTEQRKNAGNWISGTPKKRIRSEERRVGKECRTRGTRAEKKKQGR